MAGEDVSGASGRGADDVTSRSTEQRFQAIFDSSPIGMALVGTDLKFQEVNPALCDMLGYTNIELTTLGVMDVPPPGKLRSISTSCDSCLPAT